MSDDRGMQWYAEMEERRPEEEALWLANKTCQLEYHKFLDQLNEEIQDAQNR